MCERSKADVSEADRSQFSTSTLEARVGSSEQALNGTDDVKFLGVYCKCQSQVGLYNVLSASVSLFKWKVLCQTTSPCLPPSSSHCLAATLTATLSRSGSAKSVVIPHVLGLRDREAESTSSALHLWVLNPNITYAASAVEGKKNAMKVLYHGVSVDKAYEMIESLTSDVQDISLPSSVIEEAQRTLRASNNLLHERDQRFKDWDVGLLERWEPGAST